MDVEALVLPRITKDLPSHQVKIHPSWSHLEEVNLADPTFGQSGKIDVLLGVEVYVETLHPGRKTGPSGSPTAIETSYGWVICGKTAVDHTCSHLAVYHSLVESPDDFLRRFWEMEDAPKSDQLYYTREEREVIKHFDDNHTRTDEGRFIVPLPRKPGAEPLGESRLQAVRRFKSLEYGLHRKERFQEVNKVVMEYITLGHAEPIPERDRDKPKEEVFYMPIHVVFKEASTTTKIRAVFDASASGVSFNDTLAVGPTVHPQLLDVLLKFRTHKVALTTDISKMYREVQLMESDKDFHRFVWRQDHYATTG